MILGEVKVDQAKDTVVLLLARRLPLHHLRRDTAWSAHSERPGSASTLSTESSLILVVVVTILASPPSEGTVLRACSASFVFLPLFDISTILDYKRELSLAVLTGLSRGVGAISVFF